VVTPWQEKRVYLLAEVGGVLPTAHDVRSSQIR
jgi:hypothetical protein